MPEPESPSGSCYGATPLTSAIERAVAAVGPALSLQPVTLTEANRWVDDVHRHHRAPQGGLFAIGVSAEQEVVGVAIVGRPVSRHQQDGWTVEVTRVAVKEGYPNACSMLYGACWRAARSMGYRRAITYTLKSELGTSVKAAGWTEIGTAGGGTWNRKDRPRVDTHPLEQKTLWDRRV